MKIQFPRNILAEKFVHPISCVVDFIKSATGIGTIPKAALPKTDIRSQRLSGISTVLKKSQRLSNCTKNHGS